MSVWRRRIRIVMLRTNDLFVDTSGWACYLYDGDPLHLEATASVQNVLKRQHRLVTTNYVITELVALLASRYHLSRHQVIAWINGIEVNTRIEIVYIDQTLHREAWQLLEARLDKEWSLVDASSFVIMRRFGMIDALTTDHHFAQAGFKQFPEASTYKYR